MSYFSIKDFIKAGEESLKDENYWSALLVVLALPSICSRIEYDKPENSDIYFTVKNNGEKQWKDKKCYIDFCNQEIRTDNIRHGCKKVPDDFFVTLLSENFAEVLYKLRCGYIHEGDIDFCIDGKQVYFSLGENGTNTDFGNKRTISIKDLCSDIFYYTKKMV